MQFNIFWILPVPLDSNRNLTPTSLTATQTKVLLTHVSWKICNSSRLYNHYHFRVVVLHTGCDAADTHPRESLETLWQTATRLLGNRCAQSMGQIPDSRNLHPGCGQPKNVLHMSTAMQVTAHIFGVAFELTRLGPLSRPISCSVW